MSKFKEIYDKIKGWVAGIFASAAGIAAAFPLPAPAKIAIVAVGVGIPAVVGIIEIIRAIVRKVKGSKPQTITEVALASGAGIDANNMYARAVTKAKNNLRKKSKKSKSAKKHAKNFSKKMNKSSYDDLRSTGSAFSVYDIIRDNY